MWLRIIIRIYTVYYSTCHNNSTIYVGLNKQEDRYNEWLSDHKKVYPIMQSLYHITSFKSKSPWVADTYTQIGLKLVMKYSCIAHKYMSSMFVQQVCS